MLPGFLFPHQPNEPNFNFVVDVSTFREIGIQFRRAVFDGQTGS
jgi:hypothetical protein